MEVPSVQAAAAWTKTKMLEVPSVQAAAPWTKTKMLEVPSVLAAAPWTKTKMRAVPSVQAAALLVHPFRPVCLCHPASRAPSVAAVQGWPR